MNTPTTMMTIVAMLMLTALASPGPGVAASVVENPILLIEGSPQPGPPQPASSELPLYKPRKGSTPRGRVDGPVRGSGGDEVALQVLAPDHVGFTMKKDPALCWYLSKVPAEPMEFTLVDTRVIKPILETRIPAPARPGVQVTRLKDLGQTLEPGVQYKWYVSVIVDAESPSRNLIAGGTIERIDFLEAMTINLSYPGARDPVSDYAQAGLWYDAIAELSELIAAAPTDRGLRKKRASLLKQVGLPEIAEEDLRNISTP